MYNKAPKQKYFYFLCETGCGTTVSEHLPSAPGAIGTKLKKKVVCFY